MSGAAPIGSPAGTPASRLARRRLRLVRDGRAQPDSAPGAGEALAEHVLVAGGDARARERMLVELRSLLPAGTRFVEAGETWELVARAAGSRMVVLTGDLGEVSADSALRLLARRNPSLPVLAVGSDRRLRSTPRPQRSAGTRGHGEVAGAARA
jgi:hypothetical protein